MDILDDILKITPQTWTSVPNQIYDEGYCIVQLMHNSDEYRKVAREFENECRVKYIKRVQNPFQFALFKIAEEKKKAEGEYFENKKGYHVIYENDLDTALKYTVDFRRYEHSYGMIDYQQTNREPRFFTSVINAISVFPEIVSHGQNKLVLICDVWSKSSFAIETSSQADYHVNYVVCIE